MSLLAPRNNALTAPVINIAARSKQEAHQIKLAPRQMTDMLLREWERRFDQLWVEKNGVTPAMRIADLGTDAAELFAANAALVQFLVSILTGKDDAAVAGIMAKMATLPEFTANEDGTVTIA